MTELLNSLLTLLVTYGYPIAIFGIAIGYIGIPIPCDVVLIAAGSMTADGSLNLPILIIVLTLTAVLGDIAAYVIGKKLGMAFIRKHGSKIKLKEKHIISLNTFLEKWGIIAIFITRWLVTPLGTPISILAGVSKYAFIPYLIIVTLGELLWVAMFTILGNIFGSNWQSVLTYTQNIPEILLFTTIGLVLIALGIRYKKKTS